jgi:hypothetical protein
VLHCFRHIAPHVVAALASAQGVNPVGMRGRLWGAYLKVEGQTLLATCVFNIGCNMKEESFASEIFAGFLLYGGGGNFNRLLVCLCGLLSKSEAA